MSCSDGPGIVAAVSGFLFGRGANIIASDQFSTHPEGGSFYMRTVFFLPELEREREEFEAAFGTLAKRFSMSWRISYPHRRRRVALMASKADHCLLDVLWRNRRGELDMETVCVISNHELLRDEVEALGVPYLYLPVTRETRSEAEQRALEVLAGEVELVVLARYMQILSPEFLARGRGPVINIHHSFLPAFAGAEPYRHAYERGVKLIGATAHYVTEELDEGPIIEQDVAAGRRTPRTGTICSGSAATSSGWCWPAPCKAASSTTACSSTRAARSCSELSAAGDAGAGERGRGVRRRPGPAGDAGGVSSRYSGEGGEMAQFRDQLEYRLAKLMSALPASLQVALSGSPPIERDGQRLAPEQQLSLAVLNRLAAAVTEVPTRSARGSNAGAWRPCSADPRNRSARSMTT